jgi:ParB/RepB/Spo0J family partition protein
MAGTGGPQISMVACDLIDCDEQVRTEFDEDALRELAEDIKARGVQQPIKVRPRDGGRFLLVFGERRLRASRWAELARIPAIVEAMSDEQAGDIQFVENVQRENLSTAELAAAIAKRHARLKELGEAAPVDAIAAQLKKSKSWVSKYLAVGTKLSGPVARLLEDGNTQDVEVLLTLDKLREIDGQAYQEQYRAIRDGEGSRATVRAAYDAAKEAQERLMVGSSGGGQDDGEGGDSTPPAEGAAATKKPKEKEAKKPKGKAEKPPFQARHELSEATLRASTTPEQALESWGDEGRAEVAELLREQWEAGKLAAAGGPAGMLPPLMRWYDTSYQDEHVFFRAWLAGAAGEKFDVVALIASTRELLSASDAG